MVAIYNCDVISFLDNNEFGITKKDLKSDRIEVLETILFFKISNLMDIIKDNYLKKSLDFMTNRRYISLSNQLSNIDLKESLSNPRFTY